MYDLFNKNSPIMIIDLSVGNLVPPFSFNEISIEFLKQTVCNLCYSKSHEINDFCEICKAFFLNKVKQNKSTN